MNKMKFDPVSFRRGVLAAAAVADQYNSCTNLPYRLGDLVACKLNATSRQKPRKNRKRLEDPDLVLARGITTALVDVLRVSHDANVVREVARAANLTAVLMKRAEVPAHDRLLLQRAGVK